jgi:hypothetical protein
MGNLRKLAVSDVKELNQKDWGLPVELTDPDGNKYITDNVTGEKLTAIQILYDYRKLDPGTGEEITVNEPVVTIARSSLSRVPIAGERWHVRIPIEPDPDAELQDFILSETRAPEGGRSLGFINLYPQKAVQL